MTRTTTRATPAYPTKTTTRATAASPTTNTRVAGTEVQMPRLVSCQCLRPASKQHVPNRAQHAAPARSVYRPSLHCRMPQVPSAVPTRAPGDRVLARTRS